MKKTEVPATLALPEELDVTEIEMINDVFTLTTHCTRERKTGAQLFCAT